MDTAAEMLSFGNPDLPGGTPERPLVTFALFAYNQEQFIREAVEGAFSQTYSPLEIILSDDCSSDRTFQIMKEMAAGYEGAHRVMVRRESTNLGVARHFDKVVRQARGLLFLAAAGDDVSDANRAKACIEIARDFPSLGIIEVGCKNFSGELPARSRTLNQSSCAPPKATLFQIEEVLDHKVTDLIGAGRAYRRASYVRFRPLLKECPSEDTPALFRCLYGGSAALTKEELVCRRIHGGNLSGTESLLRMNFDAIERQYHLDLEEALGLGLINSADQKSLKKKMSRYVFRKKCAIDVHRGFLGKTTMGDVLLSKHFSLREKAYLLRRALLNRVVRRA